MIALSGGGRPAPEPARTLRAAFRARCYGAWQHSLNGVAQLVGCVRIEHRPLEGALQAVQIKNRSPENFCVPECFSPKYLKVPFIARPWSGQSPQARRALDLFFFFDKLGEALLGRIPSHTSLKLFSKGIFGPFPLGWKEFL